MIDVVYGCISFLAIHLCRGVQTIPSVVFCDRQLTSPFIYFSIGILEADQLSGRLT